MKIKIKLGVLLALIALFIYIITPNSFVRSGVALAKEKGSISTIGGVEIGKLDEEKIKPAIEEAIAKWVKEPVVIEGGGMQATIDKASITFDIDSTIASYITMTDKPWYAFWEKEKVVHLPLNITNSDVIKKELSKYSIWKSNETSEKVVTAISYLKKGAIQAELENLSFMENDRLSLAIESIPLTSKGVYDVAMKLNDFVIGPGQTFSLLQALGEEENVVNAEGLNFIASILYYHALNTNTTILERHAQMNIPPYLEAGTEAQVDVAQQKDLQFVNSSNTPYLLKMSVETNELKSEVYTTAKQHSVVVRVNNTATVEPHTIVRYSNDLPIGQQRVLQEGEAGLRVAVFRAIDGTEDVVSKDYYAPINRILVKSARQLTGNGTTSTNTTDPDLQMDLNGDGLPDVEQQVDENGNTVAPSGSYYNKAGELVTTSDTKTETAKPTPTSFANCDALRVYYPNGVEKGHPAYEQERDGDNDGWACEPIR